MPVTITDETLQAMNMGEREATIEIACRLFDADLLPKVSASRMAGLTRAEFDDELIKRGLPILHLDEKYWEQEMESLRRWEAQEREKR